MQGDPCGCEGHPIDCSRRIAYGASSGYDAPVADTFAIGRRLQAQEPSLAIDVEMLRFVSTTKNSMISKSVVFDGSRDGILHSTEIYFLYITVT